MKIRRYFPFFVLSLAAFTGARAADVICDPLVQGNWSNPSVWNTNTVPTAADDVYIESGCLITLDISTATAGYLQINNGSLIFSRAVDTRLTMLGDIDLNSGGVLEIGTEADPIPAASTATLVLALRDPAIKFLTIDSGATFSAWGAAKSPAAQAVNDVLKTVHTSLVVPDAQAAGWVPGDTITIGQTDRNAVWVNETEERVITGISSNGTHTTVSWTGGLTYDHLAANGIRVMNITRNVLVRSSGTAAGVNTAVFHTWFGFSGNLAIRHAEFSYLSVQWRTVNALAISSCSFHHGTSVSAEDWGGAITLSNNTFYKHLGDGLSIAPQMVVTDNDFAANGGSIFSNFSFPGDAVIKGNHIYSNSSGFGIRGVHNVVENNRIYANSGTALTLEGDENYVANNLIRDNNHIGTSFIGDNQILLKNIFRENNSTGLEARAPSSSGRDALLVSNEFFLNGNQGAHLMFPGTLMVKNNSYANGTWGLTINGSSITLVESLIGYNSAGTSSPNGSGFPEVNHSGGRLLMKGSRINPAGGIDSDGLLSYNQNFATGTAKVTGDVVLDAGASLALDNNQPTWRSTATAPILYHGTDHSASVHSTSDAGAVTQLITIRCLNGDANQWVVEGSESGVMFGPFIGGISSQNIGGQFTLSFTPDPFGGQRTDDRIAFLLTGSSSDVGFRKQVLFQDDASLTMKPGTTFSLHGTAGTPALMDLDAGQTLPFVFVSSGAFSMTNAAVRRMAAAGLHLSGTGGVAMSSVTFDSIGGAGGAYLTVRDLTSDAVMPNMAFDPATVDANNPFSVRVLGTDSGLQWTFTDFSGNKSGNASDSDPNNRIYWAGSSPVGAPGSLAAAIFSDGLQLTWTAPIHPYASFRGAYLLEYSSTSAGGPFTSLTGPLAGAVSFDHLGLLPETTYYYRLRASDLKGNTGSAATAFGRTGDFSQPSLLSVQTLEARTAGIGWTSPLTVAFNKPMNAPAVTGALTLTRVKTGLGVNISSAVAVSVLPDGTNTVYTVTPSAPLLSNSTYELAVSTGAEDPLGQPIPSSSTLRFTALMDRAVRNVATEGLGGAEVDFPAGSLAENGYVEARSSLPPEASAATAKLVSNTGDGYHRPLDSGWADLKVKNAGGVPQGPFARPAILRLSYTDANGDGIVDNTTPPLKASSLRVHRLDESLSLWQPLPGSMLDRGNRTVSAAVPHFSAYALVGSPSTDLSGAHVFPNPFVAGKSAAITFIALGQVSTVRVFTVDGLLVKELSTSDGSGRIDWDARDEDGDPLASGLYLYQVKSGDQSTTGRLAVVR